MSDVDHATLFLVVFRALLVTTEQYERPGKAGAPVQERMSDQTRRVALLLCLESLGCGRDGLSIRSAAAVARALSMDPRDCLAALDKLVAWGLLLREPRDGGLWLQLTPSALTLHERTLTAAGAYGRLEQWSDPRQLELPAVPRSRDERRDRGFRDALAAADLEAAGLGPQGAGSALTLGGDSPDARGRFPRWGTSQSGEIPPTLGGDSPDGAPASRGRFPRRSGEIPPMKSECIDMSRARPPGDSLIDYSTDQQISESSGAPPGGKSAAAPGGRKGVRFRNDDQNLCLEFMEELDPTLREENCTTHALQTRRRAWLGRLRDAPREVFRALGIVRDEKLTGDKAMARLYKATKELGGKIKSVLFGVSL